MDFALARAAHVLAIVLWIGGVGFVTTVLFPAIRRSSAPGERLAAFVRFEHAFAWQARISVALAGASGLYMTWRLDAWSRFAAAGFWWMHAMVCVWALFALMLFVIEPLFMHRRLEAAIRDGGSDVLFDRLAWFHCVALALAVATVLGAVGGSHGLWG